MLVRIHVYKPSAVVDTDNPAYNDIANVRPVVTADGFNTNDSVLHVNNPSDACIYLLGVRRYEGAMSCDKALSDVITRHHNF